MLRTVARTAAFVSVALIATCGLANQAFAQSWTICNKTSNSVTVAVGYEVNGGHLQSKGWWTLPPHNGCKQVLSRSETVLYNTGYLYAKMSNGSNPVVTGDQDLCVQSKAFTIRRSENCEGRNFRTVKARQISININKNYTTNITETAKPGTVKFDDHQ